MSEKTSLQSETDEQLLQMFANSNNRDALEVLLGRHMASAYHLALKYMRNQADAEDVVQKAFINVMRFAKDQNQLGMVKAWIMKTVINTSKNEIKHLVRRRRVLTEKPVVIQNDDVSEEDTKELRQKLIAAIEQLPDHFRLPIWLTHYENMSVKEVSHALGRSENTIRTQLSRGLEKLQNMFKGKGAKAGALNIAALLVMSKKFEVVPASLTAKVQKISHLRESARLFASSGPKTAGLSFGLLVKSILILLSICGLYVFQKNINVEQPVTLTESEKIVEIQQGDMLQPESKIVENKMEKGLDMSWDFSSADLPDWCVLQAGTYEYVENKKAGFGRTMKITGDETLDLKLNIPQQNKPFRVSYDIMFTPVVGSNSQQSSLWLIGEQNFITFEVNNILSEGRWYHVECFIQEKVQSIFFDGQLFLVVVGPKDFAENHNIKIHTKIAYMDNLKIETLEDDELKDFSECYDLCKGYFEKKGFHKMSIPSPFPKYKKGEVKVFWNTQDQ